MIFLTVIVGKKIPSNKINILILSKNLHYLVEKYFFFGIPLFRRNVSYWADRAPCETLVYKYWEKK